MNSMYGDDLSAKTRCEQLQCHLDEISEEISRCFGTMCQFDHFHILALTDVALHVEIIFKKERYRRKYERNANGVQQRLVDFMHAAIKRQGIGSKSEICIEYELDSNEARKQGLQKGTANIPSNEDFARASRLMEQESRQLDEIAENVKQHYKERCSLHDAYLFPERGNFRACVFFEKDQTLELCMRDGITQEIENFVYAELERTGRGTKGKIRVAFEFDSDERVNAEFEGDYYNCRLRAGAQPKFGKFGGEVLVL